VTTTLTATPDPTNSPPRVLLNLTYTGQTSATIVRNDPDGSQTPVRLAEPVTLDGTGSAVLYDYESWFGSSTTYTATTAGGSITSSAVILDVGAVWLRHPGIPSLSRKIDFHGEGDPVRAVNQAVLQPLGRSTPVVLSDGQRKAKTGTITIWTASDTEHANLLGLLDDLSVLLLDVPPSWEFGADLTHQYLSIGDVTMQRRIEGYYVDPNRIWTAPYIVVGRSAGGVQSQRTWATVLAAYATWQDVRTRYATWTDVLTGP
jgi:hypothetical protein